MRKKVPMTIVLLLALFCSCGDPGYRLQPVGWHSMSEGKWTKKFDDFEIHTRGIEGLIGEWWVDPDFQIVNNTKTIQVEGAELRTATEKFFAEVYSKNPIPPSKNGYHIPIEWRFEQKRAAPGVLGDHCEIVLNLRVGGEVRQITVEYVK